MAPTAKMVVVAVNRMMVRAPQADVLAAALILRG